MQQQIVNFGSASTLLCFSGSLSLLNQWAPPDKTFIITDENVLQYHKDKLKSWKVVAIPSGESSKNLTILDDIIRQLLALGAERDALIVGVGGGVVTDIAGLVAGIYKRGVACGLVPTSLLAMVDAAVGGKNGLDVGEYKNMIGLIRQPKFLLYDYNFLNTLPDIEWTNGFAEIIKHAAIGDRTMFCLLQEQDINNFKKDNTLLDNLVQRNVLFKSGIVQRDEQEKGERKLLNFGHTLGHAIENRHGLPHGHAVAIGMVFACRISERKLGFKDTNTLEKLLHQYQLPSAFDFDRDGALHNMEADKKKTGNKIAYILLQELGEARVYPISIDEIKEMF